MLRVRTGYSFRNAVGSLPLVMERLKEIGAEYAPIVDRASTFGFVQWDALAKANGLKPVFGIELAVSPNPQAKKPVVDYWTFIATDSLEPLFELLEIATDQFRYQPVLDYRQAQAANCIKIMGRNARPEHVDLLTPDLFMELTPATSAGGFSFWSGAGARFVAMSENKFPTESDFPLFETVCGFNARSQTYPQHILSEDEWRDAVKPIANETVRNNALQAAKEIASRSNATLKKAVMLSPERPKPLREMCVDGAKGISVDLSKPEYAERLDRELSVIAEKEFEDYFYIIADVVEWARKRMVVGPARGSSCGSLVCYLLGITTVDPLEYDLLFERFIDVNRADLPDIDIDFSDTQRHRVFEYLAEKYGSEHVVRLGTVAFYKAPSALQETCRALKIPRWEADKALEGFQIGLNDTGVLKRVFDETPKGRAFLKKHPEARIAEKLEGHPRHAGQHAAGVLLTQEPVREYVGVDARTGATHCDKRDAEALDLLKIDALGLKQLSVFEDALDTLGLPVSFLDTIPLDDQQAFDVLNKGHFSGVFQFQGAALQGLTKQVHVSELADIIAITALGRPATLNSGGAQEWVDRKNGQKPVVYPAPVFEPFLKETQGILVYQEQVMKIAREIGRMSWPDVSAMRRAIGKSKGEAALEKFHSGFTEGALQNGLEKHVIDDFWKTVVTFGAYGFNKSHAAAYGIVSYWCCWFKAHHPVEFAAATLTHETDPHKQRTILRELEAEGVRYIPVDAELSVDRWRRGKDGLLIGPVQNVKGIGPKMVQQIVSARARNEPLPDRARKLLENPKTDLDDLWPIRSRFKEIVPDPIEYGIVNPIVELADLPEDGPARKIVFPCTFQMATVRDENDAKNLERRGKRRNWTKTKYLSVKMADDTGEIYGKISAQDYDKLAAPIVERGGLGKELYLVRADIIGGSRFAMVKNVRYLGKLSE